MPAELINNPSIHRRDTDAATASEIADVLNRNSVDTATNAPDFILADLVVSVLHAVAKTNERTAAWHTAGREGKPAELTDEEARGAMYGLIKPTYTYQTAMLMIQGDANRIVAAMRAQGLALVRTEQPS